MYSDSVMQAVRQNLDLHPYDTSRDDEIKEMSRTEVFERCLNWDGIVGYSEIILDYVNGIYNVDLEPRLKETEAED